MEQVLNSIVSPWFSLTPDTSTHSGAITAKLVEILNRAFEYFGGIPKQLVFDQDKIVAVSENYGDIIYTHEFERY